MNKKKSNDWGGRRKNSGMPKGGKKTVLKKEIRKSRSIRYTDAEFFNFTYNGALDWMRPLLNYLFLKKDDIIIRVLKSDYDNFEVIKNITNDYELILYNDFDMIIKNSFKGMVIDLKDLISVENQGDKIKFITKEKEYLL